jgi:prevent-host-death family protein
MSERQISATEFKAKCLSLLDEVAASGQPLVVTKRGKPVARVTKAGREARPFMGGMRGRAVEVGDIVYNTSGEWEAS